MNPDKCARCHQMVDPFDSEYCIWNGQRWHVSCALREANDSIETMREKQGRYDTTAANYSALQAKIDDMLDQREGLLKIMRGVPQQAQDLGMIFMRGGEKLVRRDRGGHLLEGESDSRNLFGLPQGNKNLLEGGSDV